MYRKLKVRVGTPGGLSQLAQRVSKSYKCSLLTQPALTNTDLIVVVDTGHVGLLDEWGDALSSVKAPKVFIDHHPLDESTRQLADHLVIDKSVSSTCELVFTLFTAKKVPLNRRTAQALLIGILFDSHHLALAGYKAIKTVLELCDLGASISKAKGVLNIKRNRSEVIARLKASQRAKIVEIEGWLTGISKVGSYQASASGALVNLGVDVALVLGKSEGTTKGSLRSSQTFHKETRVHLGEDIAGKIGQLTDGFGGGHPTAASFTSHEKMDAVQKLALKLLSETMSSRSGQTS